VTGLCFVSLLGEAKVVLFREIERVIRTPLMKGLLMDRRLEDGVCPAGVKVVVAGDFVVGKAGVKIVAPTKARSQ